jgi:hypothetical protein
MEANIPYCPGCMKQLPSKTHLQTVLICPNCICSYQKVGNKIEFLQGEKAVLEDMTPLRLETTGRWEGKSFEIMGRIQYFFENNYRNLWALLFAGHSFGWLAESYGDYAVYTDEKFTIAASKVVNLKAGRTLELPGNKSYDVTRVDKNISIHKEGELPEYLREDAGFTCIELSLDKDKKVFIHSLPAAKVAVYTAKISAFNQFNFKHTRELRGWI